MSYQFIKIAKEEKVATLTLDRPPVNALNTALMGELDQAIEELTQASDVKVIIIAGAGQYAFVAGADINEIAAIENEQQAKAASQQGQSVFNKIENANKPIICAITGPCVGGGLELAMSCHLRIASDKAKMGQPEINLGIMPGFGGSQRLARIVGPSKACELILTGDTIPPQEAHRLGLVNKVVPDADTLKTAKNLAKKIAEKSAPAIQHIVKTIRAGIDLPLQDALALESEGFAKTCMTEDRKEGCKAFLEKRQPKFQDK